MEQMDGIMTNPAPVVEAEPTLPSASLTVGKKIGIAATVTCILTLAFGAAVNLCIKGVKRRKAAKAAEAEKVETHE